jgi:hypothetical protein
MTVLHVVAAAGDDHRHRARQRCRQPGDLAVEEQRRRPRLRVVFELDRLGVVGLERGVQHVDVERPLTAAVADRIAEHHQRAEIASMARAARRARARAGAGASAARRSVRAAAAPRNGGCVTAACTFGRRLFVCRRLIARRQPPCRAEQAQAGSPSLDVAGSS